MFSAIESMKRMHSTIEVREETTPRKTFKSAPTLTNLADELIMTVLSYFHSYGRSKFRLVCRRLKNVVDAMPPPDSLLEIQLLGCWQSPQHENSSKGRAPIGQSLSTGTHPLS